MKLIWEKGRKYLWIPSLGILYYIWIRMTGLLIPCMFRKITGWLCPGCGVTTLFYRLFQLDFERAFMANPFLFVTMPFIAAEILWEIIRRETGRKEPKWNRILVMTYLILLVLFGVWRNVHMYLH